MLYKLAHILRDRCPWIWDGIELMDSYLFYMRYGRKLRGIEEILKRYQERYTVVPLNKEDIPMAVEFFKRQPEEAFTFFKPHGFDGKTLGKIQRSRSFLAYLVKDNEEIVGYFFLRCYFMGKAFRGYMVDHGHRNMGISKLTARVMTDITEHIGIPSFGTIAPENIASMKSQNATIIEQLENGDYYVKY